MSDMPTDPPPFRPGERQTGIVDNIAFGGEGVLRLAGLVVFVPFVLPGELVEVEFTEIRRSFAKARLVRVIEPSPDRVAPVCRYFGECGGCQYQHAAYPVQLSWKHRQVADLMERLGKLDPACVAPLVPCPQPYGYRNRIMIRSQWQKPLQRLVIGFVRHDCGLVVDVEECAIAEPEVSAGIREVRANPPPKGGLKVVLRQFPEGWELPRDSFFQNNFHLLPGLVEVVRERLREAAVNTLLDLYCGVGFFGIELAGEVDRLVGVEIDRMAIQAARANAARRGCRNGEFLLGDAPALLPELLARFATERVAVLVDPPRRGCAPGLLDQLIAHRPAQVVYVSCHPATLARDLRRLVESGAYRLDQVIPLDMFPQTQHVECVADLRSVAA